MIDTMHERRLKVTSDKPQASPSTIVEELVHRHQVGLWRYLRTLGCTPDTADELVQETFLVVLRRPFDDRGPAASGAFLMRTAYRLWLKDRRRRQPKRDVEAADKVWQAIAARDDGSGWFEAVSICLGTLAPRARRAVVACHVEDRKRAEVAAELGLAIEGLKTLLRRAIATLKECTQRRMSS